MTLIWLTGGAAVATLITWEVRRALRPGGAWRTLMGERHETTIYWTKGAERAETED